MSLNILIVEGNPKALWEERLQKYGLCPYHQRFQKLLKHIDHHISTDTAFPCEEDWQPLTLSQIKEYDGIIWTGSSLNIYHRTPPILRQLKFADLCFESGVPIYGSCWGLQVAAMVCGGMVGKCEKGKEFGFSQPIHLTKKGESHPFFKDKKGGFSALCIHEDDISILPPNAEVLAYNSHSKVQALSVRFKNSTFFGVQYHPEFTLNDIKNIATINKEKLLAENIFNSELDYQSFIDKLDDKQHTPNNILDYESHYQEIAQWLSYVKKGKSHLSFNLCVRY